jgi:hypothetical protein
MTKTIAATHEHPCAECPWRAANAGKPSPVVDGHRYRWYSKANLSRLWAGLRRGEMMTCHPTDPRMIQRSGKTVPESATTFICAGATILVQRELVLFQEGSGVPAYRRARPRGLTRLGMIAHVERYLLSATGHASRPDLNDPAVQHAPLGEWSPR